MSAFLRGLGTRLRALVRRQAAARELDEEIRLHLELEAEQNRRRGMSPDEARRQAAIAFGGIDVAKESHRDALGIRWIEDTIADARFALAPAQLVFKRSITPGSPPGTGTAELTMVIVDARLGRVSWRTVARGDGPDPWTALTRAVKALTPGLP